MLCQFRQCHLLQLFQKATTASAAAAAPTAQRAFPVICGIPPVLLAEAAVGEPVALLPAEVAEATAPDLAELPMVQAPPAPAEPEVIATGMKVMPVGPKVVMSTDADDEPSAFPVVVQTAVVLPPSEQS